MRILYFFLIGITFYTCKSAPNQLDDFPIDVITPLIDGDPLKIYWDLHSADSLKLDNDVFFTSDTAYYYVTENDIIRIRVYSRGEVVYEKYLRYQLADGENLGVVYIENYPYKTIPNNFLGYAFSFKQSLPLIGEPQKSNTPLINLLKNIHSKNRTIPLYIHYKDKLQDEGPAFIALKHLLTEMDNAGYLVELTFELPLMNTLDFLQKIQYHLESKFIKAYVIPNNIADINLLDALDASKKELIYHVEQRSLENNSTSNLIHQNRRIILNIMDCHNNPVSSALTLLDYLWKEISNGTKNVYLALNTDTENCNPFSFEIPRNNLYEEHRLNSEKTYPEQYLIKNISPIYYSLWLMADQLIEGNQLMQIRIDSSTHLSAYGIMTKEDKPRYILINQDSLGGYTFIYDTMIYRSWNARMIAPQFPESDNFIYAGRTLSGSTDGKPKGSYYTDKINGRSNGNKIPLAAMSVVVVQGKH